MPTKKKIDHISLIFAILKELERQQRSCGMDVECYEVICLAADMIMSAVEKVG